ncbi:MAG TPA: hypothetical protein ACYCC7_00315 [Candidatus Azoamicus sp. MARI]
MSCYFFPIDMHFINEVLIFSMILKQNKKYSYQFKKYNFPCIINSSKNTTYLILKFINVNNNKLISIKYILNIIKHKHKNNKLFFKNKFSNFNTLLDLFVCK